MASSSSSIVCFGSVQILRIFWIVLFTVQPGMSAGSGNGTLNVLVSVISIGSSLAKPRNRKCFRQCLDHKH
jgi:hypothetical protein